METYQPTKLRDNAKHPLKKTQYTIGTKHEDREGIAYGMWYGPSPNEIDMLEIVGRNSRDRIIKFNADGTNEEVWKWKEDCWVKICK